MEELYLQLQAVTSAANRQKPEEVHYQCEITKTPFVQCVIRSSSREYDFTIDSQFSIPCDEDTFLSVVQCARSPRNRRIPMCF
ncbi:hypothetical protein R6Q57_003918 [Mikania cordata]